MDRLNRMNLMNIIIIDKIMRYHTNNQIISFNNIDNSHSAIQVSLKILKLLSPT